MVPERQRQVEQVYHAALERRSDQRAAFLDQACAGDAALRKEVESLLSFAGNVGVAAQASASSATADVIRTLGRYELLEKIGHGGIGVVYRAMETETQRAVKASIVF
jgi:serine/threonine protein kinase